MKTNWDEFEKMSQREQMTFMLKKGKIPNNENMIFFIEATKNKNRAVRYCAAGQLANFKKQKSMEALLALLQNEHEYPSVRARAIDSIQEIKFPHVVPILEQYLIEKSPMIRYMAVFALGVFANPRSEKKLKEIFKNDSGAHRRYGKIKKIARWSLLEIEKKRVTQEPLRGRASAYSEAKKSQQK